MNASGSCLARATCHKNMYPNRSCSRSERVGLLAYVAVNVIDDGEIVSTYVPSALDVYTNPFTSYRTGMRLQLEEGWTSGHFKVANEELCFHVGRYIHLGDQDIIVKLSQWEQSISIVFEKCFFIVS